MVAPLVMMGLSAAAGLAGSVADAVGGKDKVGGPASGPDKLRTTANEFESVFLEHVMDRLTESGGAEGPLGEGGTGGSVYRSMLAKEYAGQIVKSGGVGLSDAVYRQMLRLQEGGGHGGA